MARTRRNPNNFVQVTPPEDGRLYLVRVEPGIAILSTGEEVAIRYERMAALAEWLCQECTPVRVRTWQRGKFSTELVELHADRRQ